MNENNYLKRFIRGIDLLKEMRYPYITGGRMETMQKKMLFDMLSYAVRHCAYYRNLGISGRSLSEFPFLTKQLIRENFDDLTSDEKDRFIYWDAFTGGTTGQPMHFLNQNNIDRPYEKMLWKRMGYKRGDVIVAMVGYEVSRKDLDNNIFWSPVIERDIPYGRVKLSSYYYSDKRAPHYIRRLNELKPAFIRGYPSFVYEFSRCLIENGITLSFVPKAIQLTSEPSFDYQYESIKKAFKTDKIVLQYGHTECSVFGYTYDDTYEYIIEPLYGITEIVDEDGNEVEEGEMGEVVVTSLYNKVMPLIRYKTGDNAVKGSTVDGKLHIRTIVGRTWDYIIDRDGSKILDPLIFENIVALDGIARWQIEQSEPGTIIMHIIKENNYRNSDEDEIRDIFDRISNVDVVFDYVDDIPPTPRGKHLNILQHIRS